MAVNRPIPGTDLSVHPICLGLGDFGTRVAGRDAQRLLDGFIAAGGNFLDTAHCYAFWIPGGDGASERQLGDCVRALGCREKLVIVTKGAHPDGGDAYPRPDRYLSPEVVAADLDDSLARLQMEYVDLYLLHRDDARVPVGEVIDLLNREIARGRVRYIGASNWPVGRIAEANDYAATHGLAGFCVSEVYWSLADPTWEVGPDPTMRYLSPGDADWHAASGLPVMAYSASAGGYFARRESAEERYGTATNAARRERAECLAGQLGCTPAQLALAYLLGHAFPAYPIAGTLRESHLAEAMAAADLVLTGEQVRWLRDG